MLTIVGTGIRRPQQMTLEGVAAIKSAKRVLHLTATEKPIDALLDKLGASNRRSLEELYRLGTLDEENYQRLAREVTQEVEHWHDVALLLYGHPRLGVTLTKLLESALPGAVRVLPATSSFDTMINDLRRDPLERGSVMLDATRLLLFELNIEPFLDYYIYHVDAVATRVLSNVGGNGSRTELLRDYLLRFYPGTHKVKLLLSEAGQGDCAAVVEVAIAELEAVAEHMSMGASLFIPGLKPTRLSRNVYDLLRASAAVAPPVADDASAPASLL